MKRNDSSRLVYSSEHGRMCGECGRPAASCSCRRKQVPAGDGIVRLRRETKGRGGKTVTVLSGIPLESEALKELAGELKRACGSGGTVKEGVVEIQGDHLETLLGYLEKRGFRVKQAGG